jgi:hypothetical protein
LGPVRDGAHPSLPPLLAAPAQRRRRPTQPCGPTLAQPGVFLLEPATATPTDRLHTPMPAPPLATSGTWEPRRHDASSTSDATGAAPSYPILKPKFEEPLTPHRRHRHLPRRTACLPPSPPYKRHPRALSPHQLPIPRIGSLHPHPYCPPIELCHRSSVPHYHRLTSDSPPPHAALGENHVAPLSLCPSSQQAPVDWSGRTAQV